MQKQPDTLLFESRLKDSGLSVTATRISIFEVLTRSKVPLTIQDIVSKIDNAHFVSVYRSVDALHKHGLVKQVPIGFKNKFELSDDFKPHHHHATCEKCGKSVSIHSNKVEELMNELTIGAGLNPTRHHFEAYGICEDCR
jgi:Fe2+ or Zn2+ uptake regulation protein